MREEIPAHLIDTANCHHYTFGIYPVTYLGAGRYLGMLPDRRIPGGRNGKGYGEKTESVALQTYKNRPLIQKMRPVSFYISLPLIKSVLTLFSYCGSSYPPAFKDFKSHTIFSAIVLIVCRPSRSISASSGRLPFP